MIRVAVVVTAPARRTSIRSGTDMARRKINAVHEGVPGPLVDYGERDPYDVAKLASLLLEEPSSWGLIGVEFAFFHQFFNEPLQQELRAMRRLLYERDDPPIPMTSAQAGEALECLSLYWDQMDQATPSRKESRQVTRDSGGTATEVSRRSLLKRSDDLAARIGRGLEKVGLLDSEPPSFSSLHPHLMILALPFSGGKDWGKTSAFGRVANRLDALGQMLPTTSRSIYTALVCGTPLFPPQLRALVSCDWDGVVELYHESYIRIYSAKVRDIRPVYRNLTRMFDVCSPSQVPPIESSWRDGYLPFLEIIIDLREGKVPRPSYIQRAFKLARRGQKFYDSKTKIKDYALEVEAWAKATLRLACGLGVRETLRFWAEQFLEENMTEREIDALYSRTTTSQEIVLVQQVQRISDRVIELRRLIGAIWPTIDDSTQ